MQKASELLKKAEIQVVAVSYDAVEALAKFGKEKSIEFPLLSDPDSKVIEAYKVRNPKVPHKMMEGVPLPGTFVVNKDGKITARLFLDGYEKRHSPQDLIEAVEKTRKQKGEAE